MSTPGAGPTSGAEPSSEPSEPAARMGSGPHVAGEVRTRSARRRRRAAAPARSQRPVGALGLLRETVVVVVIALGLSLVVKTFLIQAFYIPSVSMEDTLKVGDRVVVTKLVPGPFALHRGDVVVFQDPNTWLEGAAEPAPTYNRLQRVLMYVGLLPNDTGNHLIKRVIGLPGDRVKCCDQQGRVTVNGTPLDEGSYLKPGSKPSEDAFDVTVPAGKIWVMGDNRQQSADSRAHGFVPEKDVTGRALAVVWPFSRGDWLSRPGATFAKVAPASP